jgi:hypothetical protein
LAAQIVTVREPIAGAATRMRLVFKMAPKLTNIETRQILLALRLDDTWRR